MKKEITEIINSVIRKYFVLNKPGKLKTEGIREIKRLIKRYKIPFYKIKPGINPLIKQIELELQQKFFSEHLQPFEKTARQELNSIIKRNQFAVTEQQKRIEKIITKTLSSDEKELSRNLRKIKLEQRHVDTEIFTTKLALNNLQRSINFNKGDVEFLRYTGPSGTKRPFCVSHINRVYKKNEVEEMRNKFSQPALIYAGGYNCRHRWAPVFGEMEFIKDNEGTRRKLFIEEGFQQTNEGKELTIAEFRAKLGNDVTLITRSAGADLPKLYDAEENGSPVEYKRISERAKNLKTATQKHIRQGKEQSGSIVVYIDRNNFNLEAARRGIEYALDKDVNKKIKKINILNKEGKLIYERNL